VEPTDHFVRIYLKLGQKHDFFRGEGSGDVLEG
jgi:hypothetical protein